MNREYKTKHHIKYSCKYHIVFCPKYRRKVLDNGIDSYLKEVIPAIAREYNCEVIEMEVMPDHIHILIEIDPDYSVLDIVRHIKRKTARGIKDTFPYMEKRLPNIWTRSSFISSVGGAPLEMIKQYIENQKNV